MNVEDAAHVTGAVLLLVGVFFTLVAAIGLVRFRDVYARMHAASKPQFLGLMFVLAGIGLESWQWRWVVLAATVLILQFITAPVASHLVGRAAYRTGGGADLVVDELTADLETSSLGDGS
jgi:multicomponent Na+:H+ antiporter subunit G